MKRRCSMDSSIPRPTRRRFLQTSAAGVAAATLVPRRVVAGAAEVPPSETLLGALVGCGGRGPGTVRGLGPDVRIVA
ncbi:MAG TPA: twin-arginine translocation signal domain-containing protein, partial [Planctomycetaceae bacterium]|nr:twin-arginine translocation signal domain-containing protein [Planctomycetaceae bacterium]